MSNENLIEKVKNYNKIKERDNIMMKELLNKNFVNMEDYIINGNT